GRGAGVCLPAGPPVRPPRSGGSADASASAFFVAPRPLRRHHPAESYTSPLISAGDALAMMKLLSSPLSPYGRKVKMTLLMKGLADKVEIVAADTNPGDN